MQTKLLINITPIRKPLTGIGYYTLNILRELLKQNIEIVGLQNGRAIERQELIFLSENFLNESSQKSSTSGLKRTVVEVIRSIPGSYQIKNNLISYRAKKTLINYAKKNYIYFEPSFIPFDYSGKTITTIHDLSFISFPEFHPETRVSYLKSKIKSSIEKSDHVIVDSNYILEQLNDYLPSSKVKSSTVYLGVDDGFQQYTEEDCFSVTHRLGLQFKSFILSVATLEPRKNLKRLVSVYKRLPVDLRKQYPLVLVGDHGWKNSELLSEANELIENDQIIFTGYISDSDLKLLYSSALLFAYPSLYEGFGLPIIEAMASGTPVITSARGATAEVSGQAALLVDPESETSIHQAMIDFINQPKLREQYKKSGIDFVKKYKWKNTVHDLLEIVYSISNK